MFVLKNGIAMSLLRRFFDIDTISASKQGHIPTILEAFKYFISRCFKEKVIIPP